MRDENASRLIKIPLICALAAAANLLLMALRDTLQLPLFVDTVFTVAVAFALGVVPGIAVALLTWAADGALGIGNQPFHPFVLVAIAEVFLARALRPAEPQAALSPQGPVYGARDSAMRDRRTTALLGVFARLVLVYVACVISASVLGGVIDFLHRTVMGADHTYPTAINVLRMAFSREGIHVLPANVLSRVIANMVDRLFVVFGGYFASRLIARAVEKRGGQARP